MALGLLPVTAPTALNKTHPAQPSKRGLAARFVRWLATANRRDHAKAARKVLRFGAPVHRPPHPASGAKSSDRRASQLARPPELVGHGIGPAGRRPARVRQGARLRARCSPVASSRRTTVEGILTKAAVSAAINARASGIRRRPSKPAIAEPFSVARSWPNSFP